MASDLQEIRVDDLMDPSGLKLYEPYLTGCPKYKFMNVDETSGR